MNAFVMYQNSPLIYFSHLVENDDTSYTIMPSHNTTVRVMDLPHRHVYEMPCQHITYFVQ